MVSSPLFHGSLHILIPEESGIFKPGYQSPLISLFDQGPAIPRRIGYNRDGRGFLQRMRLPPKTVAVRR